MRVRHVCGRDHPRGAIRAWVAVLAIALTGIAGMESAVQRVLPARPALLAVSRIGDCPGPPSPGEAIRVRSAVTYRFERRRDLAWGLRLTDPEGRPSRAVEPNRTDRYRRVVGRETLIRRDWLLVRDAGRGGVDGVRAVTRASNGARAFVSAVTGIRLGVTLAVGVQDGDGNPLPARVSLANLGCARRAVQTGPDAGADRAVFHHVDPTARVVLTLEAEGYRTRSVRIAPGRLRAGRVIARRLTLEKLPPPRPGWTPSQLRSVLSYGDTTRPVVYLTFDDGPGAPRLIAGVLASLGVRGTFCLYGGAIIADPALLRDLREAGHAICNHGWTHRAITTLGAGEIAWELAQLEDWAVASGAGSTKPYFRPPGDFWDARTVEVVAQQGYRTIRYSVDSRDWACEMDSAGLAGYVLSRATYGSIILLHTHGCATVGALPAIVHGLRARGYSFETFDQLPSWK